MLHDQDTLLLCGTAITAHLVQAHVHHKCFSQAWPRSTLHHTSGCSFPVKHGVHESTSAPASLLQESCSKRLGTHKPPFDQQGPVLASAECSEGFPRLPSSIDEHSQDNRPFYSHSAWSLHTRSLSNPRSRQATSQRGLRYHTSQLHGSSLSAYLSVCSLAG
jgi:hypothetical protein